MGCGPWAPACVITSWPWMWCCAPLPSSTSAPSASTGQCSAVQVEAHRRKRRRRGEEGKLWAGLKSESKLLHVCVWRLPLEAALISLVCAKRFEVICETVCWECFNYGCFAAWSHKQPTNFASGEGFCSLLLRTEGQCSTRRTTQLYCKQSPTEAHRRLGLQTKTRTQHASQAGLDWRAWKRRFKFYSSPLGKCSSRWFDGRASLTHQQLTQWRGFFFFVQRHLLCHLWEMVMMLGLHEHSPLDAPPPQLIKRK